MPGDDVEDDRTVESMTTEIGQKAKIVQGKFGNGVDATYRCVTCLQLSVYHPGQNVKHCKGPKDGVDDEQVKEDVKEQLKTMTEVVSFMENADSAEGRVLEAQTELVKVQGKLADADLEIAKSIKALEGLKAKAVSKVRELGTRAIRFKETITKYLTVMYEYKRGERTAQDVTSMLVMADQALQSDAKTYGVNSLAFAADVWDPMEVDENSLGTTPSEAWPPLPKRKRGEAMETELQSELRGMEIDVAPTHGTTSVAGDLFELMLHPEDELEDIPLPSGGSPSTRPTGVATTTSGGSVSAPPATSAGAPTTSGSVFDRLGKPPGPPSTPPPPPPPPPPPVLSSGYRGDPKPTVIYPGLYEMPPGTVLTHQSGGRMLGGKPDGTVIGSAHKREFERFVRSDTPLQYLAKKRRFWMKLDTFYCEATIYDLAAIFRLYAMDYAHLVDGMNKKEAFFTSFEHYLRFFETKSFSNIKQFASNRIRDLKQANRKVGEFHLDYMDLLKVLERNPNDWIDDWISRLSDERVRSAVLSKFYEEGTRTLELVSQHAEQVEQNFAGSRASVVGGVAAGAGGAAGGGGGAVGGGGGGGGGGGEESGEGKKKKKKKKAAAAAATAAVAVHPHYQKCDRDAKLKEWMGMMKDSKLRGCCGCFSFKHKFAWDFSKCGDHCLFCQKKFTEATAHAAVECPQKPTDRAAALEKIQKHHKQQ